MCGRTLILLLRAACVCLDLWDLLFVSDLHAVLFPVVVLHGM